MDVPSYFKSLSTEMEAPKNRVRQFIDDRHWLTDGEWKEGVLRSFLRRSFPKTVEIGRGFIVTDDGVSKQIDVLIFDASKPILFRDGDLVFITPDAVEGVIEVKSSINPTMFHEACGRLIVNAELVFKHSPRHRPFHKFFSIYSFENQVRDDHKYLEVLRDLSNAPNRLLQFCCLGQDTFIRYWELDPANPDGYITNGIPTVSREWPPDTSYTTWLKQSARIQSMRMKPYGIHQTAKRCTRQVRCLFRGGQRPLDVSIQPTRYTHC